MGKNKKKILKKTGFLNLGNSGDTKEKQSCLKEK